MDTIYVFVLVLLPSAIFAVEKTVCELKLDTATCSNGQMIQVDSVFYGRSQNALCNTYNNNYQGVRCVSTQISTNAVKSNCQGRSTCLLQADNTILGEDPCPGTPKYLTVRYHCVNSFIPTNFIPMNNFPTVTTPLTTPSTLPTTSTPTTTTPSPRLPTGVLPIGGGPISNGSGKSRTAAHVCHGNLVSGPRGVPDGQISASSQLSLSNNAHRGRLYLGITKRGSGATTFTLEGGWTADPNDPHPWIQVKMNWLTIIQGVTTQGRHVNPGTVCCQEWTTKYKVKYSIDGLNWEYVKDKTGQIKTFIGNQDSDTPVFQLFDCPITARYLRIEVVDFVGRASLRFEVTGCPTNTDDLGKCPHGWKQRPNTNTCYYISDQSDRKSWENGQLMCKRHQGDIVKIDSVAEKIWLESELQKLSITQKLDKWWVGLNNRPRFDNNNYKWDDGSSLDTSVLQWSPSEPNNSGGREHCAAYILQSDSLNDLDCDKALPFICEMPMYWKGPVNAPSLVTKRPTMAPTMAPSTAFNLVPVPIGVSPVTSNKSVFSTGCLKPSDCNGRAWKDYPSCSGCGYYLTCAPSGAFARRCPLNLKFDDNVDACVAKSSTCRGP